MLNINELTKELSISVENIICNHWDPCGHGLTEGKKEYRTLVTDITFITIEKITETGLAESLLNIEEKMAGAIADPERCRRVAKLLKNALDTHHQKAFYKARKERREKMDSALKEITIPFLRKQGFKGSFPNFKLKNGIEEISLQFQFSQFGCQFVVELKTSDLREPLRLGSIINKRDYWYDFEKEIPPDIFKTKAQEIIDNWHEAENWMNNK